MKALRNNAGLADVRGASWMAVFGLVAFLVLILGVHLFAVLPFRLLPICMVLMGALLLNIGLAVFGGGWAPSKMGVLLYESGHAVAYTVVLHFVGVLQGAFGFAFVVYTFLVVHSMMLHPGSPALLTANIGAACYAVLVWWESQGWIVAGQVIQPAFAPGERIALIAFGFLSLNYVALFVKRYGRQLREFAQRLEHTVSELQASNRELELANRRAERGEEYFRALIERGSDLVWILSDRGYIQYASPSHARVLGYAPEDLVGRRGNDFIHPDDREETKRLFQYIVRNPGRVVRNEFRFRHRDGSWRCLESVALSRLPDPVVAGAVVNLRDVTERKEAERQLAAYAAELEKQRQEIGTFIYTVTHDLKNPVNAILLTADLMLEREGETLSEAGRARLRRIVRLADGADRMVRDLLDLVKITSKPEAFAWVDLQAVVAQSLEGFAAQIAAKGVGIEVGALPFVWGQPGKLGHVVDNLLSNAIKYVACATGRVELSGWRNDGAIVVCVRDNGVGIPRAYHERIFKIFGRVPAGEQGVEDHATAGTGVGLTIVKRIVETHGGSVSVVSEPGKGSSFYVRLPEGPDARSAPEEGDVGIGPTEEEARPEDPSPRPQPHAPESVARPPAAPQPENGRAHGLRVLARADGAQGHPGDAGPVG